MVGWSIVSIADLSAHTYLGTMHLGKYGTSVVYFSYGPPYRILYTLHIIII